MILITTTRRPSRRTRSFVRDLFHVLPDAVRRNRGKMSLEDVNELALELGASRILIVGTSKGNPSSLVFYKPDPSHIIPLSSFHLTGATLRREMTERRAPRARSLCVTYSSTSLSGMAELLTLAFEAEGTYLGAKDSLGGIEECDLSLHLEPLESGALASFYWTKPLWEVGPRMRIGRYSELAESQAED